MSCKHESIEYIPNVNAHSLFSGSNKTYNSVWRCNECGCVILREESPRFAPSSVLFLVICNILPSCAWKAKKEHDGTMYGGKFIVGINTPEGQVSYHYDVEPYWDMFHVPEIEYAPKWDGHTRDEAIRRIGLLGLDN